MPVHRDTPHRLGQLLRSVSAVTELDPGVQTLRSQLADFERTAGQTPILDLLADAVARGDTDQPLLFAAALTEQHATAQTAAAVVEGVRHRLHRRIRDRAAATGTDAYAAVAAQFTAAADRLLAVHKLVDLEAPAERVVDMADKPRKGWRDAPGIAAELDRLAPALHAAAVLAGVCADTPDAEIAVCVESTGLDPHLLADAWNTPEREAKAARSAQATSPFTGLPAATQSRCGRWSALIKAGATIRAVQPELATT